MGLGFNAIEVQAAFSGLKGQDSSTATQGQHDGHEVVALQGLLKVAHAECAGVVRLFFLLVVNTPSCTFIFYPRGLHPARRARSSGTR